MQIHYLRKQAALKAGILILSLQEASIADISYLFEEGALVDFKIEELVNLVRALFADTPLRTNTINKLMQGHPMLSP